MKRTPSLCLLFLILLSIAVLPLRAQLFRQLTPADGMTSRHVIAIGKDRTGYMWMLNHEGVERYDGSRMRHYNLIADDGPISPTRGLATLATDSAGTLWVISHTGDLFRYDDRRDAFVAALDFALLKPEEERRLPITTAYMDTARHAIWLCTRQGQYIFSLTNQQLEAVPTGIREAVYALTRTDEGEYFLATKDGVFTLNDAHPALTNLKNVRHLYYHPQAHLLLLATASDGLYLYDIRARGIAHHLTDLKDVDVSTVCPVPGDGASVYVATQGAGLYRFSLTSGHLTPFLQANPNTPHSLQSDILNDLYIDADQRLWMATYPMGVSIYSERYPAHEWICHSYDNANSLSSGQVHDILEDRDGDLWFATNNGISCQHVKTGRWTTLLTATGGTPSLAMSGRTNYTFTALCDLGDGALLAGGYMTGLYLIHKATMQAEHLDIPDKYIRSILRTHDAEGRPDGLVWIGGQTALTCYDLATRRVRKVYHPGFPIASLAEQDDDGLWIGTLNGLYRLQRRTRQLVRIQPHTELGRVTSICRARDGATYFATLGDGLWAYDTATGHYLHYGERNSSLHTDDIYCVLPAPDGRLILSTERGISLFHPQEGRFYHWGQDQGLRFTSFNPGAGLHTRSGRFLFGTEEGTLSFSDTVTLPRPCPARLVLDDLRIRYQPVTADSPDSPLADCLDRTRRLTLAHDQNILSMEVSSIHFDNPSAIRYTWRLEGFYNAWCAPTTDTRIRYTNLSPGRYHLTVRSLRADDLSIVDERQMEIRILPPWWLSWPALTVYALLFLALGILICRMGWKRRERRIARRHAVITLLTAQEMMEPLEQIREPLSRLQQDASLSREGQAMVSEALRQTESLDELFMRRVGEIVQNNLRGNALSVDKLCTELGISRTTLYNRLKEITGEAPADYLRRLRLDESARLLLTREYTVAEVSDMMGFSDPKYFTEVFKRYFGLTPTQYVKQQMRPHRGAEMQDSAAADSK